MTAPARLAWQPARIARKERQTARVVSLYLDCRLPAQRAGQHVDIRLTAPDGYQAQRSYSIASPPGAELLELTVEKLEDGEVSPFLHDVAEAGDEIELRGPIGGHFVWRPEDGGPLLLLGGGSGIVPLAAIARLRAEAAPDVPALMAYSARRWEELIFREELLAAAAEQPDFRLVLTTTRGPRQRPGDHERRFDAMLIGDILAGWGRAPARTYVCGSNAFVEGVTQALVKSSIPPAGIRVERYGG